MDTKSLLGKNFSPPEEEHEPADLHKAAPEDPLLREGASPGEEIVDEALEETFPASDPPFWMPVGR
jgi:hypothetical protein